MSLPEPDVHGVWSFGPTLLESHREHLARLAVAVPQEELVTRAVPTAAALHDAEEWLSVRRRSRRGRPLVAVEPHADDMVLSAGGFALTCGRPLHTVTVFSEGSSLHYEYDNVVRADRSTVTQWRHRESTTASELLSATSESLGLAEAPVGSGMSSCGVTELVDFLSDALERWRGAELLAPAAVSTHPDHLAVHTAARKLGCTLFWDDTSVHGGYAQSVDDSMLFSLRVGADLAQDDIDITDAVLDKVTLLRVYRTQIRPERDLHKPIRYNWTTACRAGLASPYAERFHRLLHP